MWHKIKLWLLVPYVLPHELCHYIPARLMGFETRLEVDRVRIGPHIKTDWQILLVTLAPSGMGLFLLAGAAWLGWLAYGQSEFWAAILVGLAINVIWQLACLDDFFMVWFWLRYNRWPEDSEMPPDEKLEQRLASLLGLR